MSRTLSSVAKQAMFGQETAEVFLLLLTIAGTGITTLHFVNNYENVTSNGQVYTAFPFEIALPEDTEERPPRMRIKIDNVDRQIVQAVRSLTSPPTITLSVVLASQPNTVEASFPGFTLRNVRYDALVVEGELLAEDVLSEPYPAGSFTPTVFQGLF